jgi:exodeoxyribonuclease VII large subunit
MNFDSNLDAESRLFSPLSVSQITSLIRNNLENKFPDVIIEGEVSNCKMAASGHLYFSLKDEEAILQVVMFRRDLLTLDFVPKDGMQVWARGAISVYAQRGQYQLIARNVRQTGFGDILAMLEQRRRKFAEEGLFDESRKKEIPAFPTRLGVVTSPTGAAIRDIIRVIQRRNPKVSILILPTLVQGQEAAASIAERIRQANLWNLADVLIVGRGGGSIEDLLPFSEEVVIHAIVESNIPIISAVGHETDWALSDYAADLRAPTPSAAAEMACADLYSIYKEIAHFENILGQSMKHSITNAKQRLFSISPHIMEDILLRKNLVASQRFDSAIESIRNSFQKKAEDLNHRLVLASSAIEIANPREIMKRGFSVVKKNGVDIVHSSRMLALGDSINIMFYEGEADADVKATRDYGDKRSSG